MSFSKELVLGNLIACLNEPYLTRGGWHEAKYVISKVTVWL